MAITFVAASTQAQGASSPIDANLPSGYATGDLLVAVITTREDSPTPVHGITTGGASWTQIGTTQFRDLGTTGIAQSCWYRFAASASEATPSASCPTPNLIDVTIVAFRGVDSTTPLDGVTVIGSTYDAAATAQPNVGTGITTATDGAWVVAVVSTADNNALNYNNLNGFTDRFSGLDYDDANGAGASQAMATLEKATAGNQTAPTFNQSTNGNDVWAWHLFVLRPASAATVTATGAGAWGAWTATASATPKVVATAAGTWGALSATATAAVSHSATAAGAWGAWTATATANVTAVPTTPATGGGRRLITPARPRRRQDDDEITVLLSL